MIQDIELKAQDFCFYKALTMKKYAIKKITFYVTESLNNAGAYWNSQYCQLILAESCRVPVGVFAYSFY